jgi:hypothetical protein
MKDNRKTEERNILRKWGNEKRKRGTTKHGKMRNENIRKEERRDI